MKDALTNEIRRLRSAWVNSLAGLRAAIRREQAVRTEFCALVVAVPVAFWLGSTLSQTGLLIGSILFLLIVEILNSAIETVVDRIGPERHELSRIAKDLGSAAVFLTALFPAGIWGAVVLSKLGFITL